MAEGNSYTRRFSDVYLAELEYVAKRRSDLEGLDAGVIERLRNQASQGLAEHEGAGEAGPNAYEPPPTVLTVLPGDDTGLDESKNLKQQIETMAGPALWASRCPVGGFGLRRSTWVCCKGSLGRGSCGAVITCRPSPVAGTSAPV